ncbi:MAG: cytochrome c [Alphaproteobacteria bacterium]|nr:cytochrome c [Alphaproteobacteria bacterium]
MKVTLFAFYGVSAALLTYSAHAVELGDATRGLSYAQQVCAECHSVEDDGMYSPNPDAPSFKAIADTSGMTGTAIAVWLQTSHPTMPDLIIAPQDTDDLIAYILSLRSKSSP